eukprot:RCo045723
MTSTTVSGIPPPQSTISLPGSTGYCARACGTFWSSTRVPGSMSPHAARSTPTVPATRTTTPLSRPKWLRSARSSTRFCRKRSASSPKRWPRRCRSCYSIPTPPWRSCGRRACSEIPPLPGLTFATSMPLRPKSLCGGMAGIPPPSYTSFSQIGSFARFLRGLRTPPCPRPAPKPLEFLEWLASATACPGTRRSFTSPQGSPGKAMVRCGWSTLRRSWLSRRWSSRGMELAQTGETSSQDQATSPRVCLHRWRSTILPQETRNHRSTQSEAGVNDSVTNIMWAIKELVERGARDVLVLGELPMQHAPLYDPLVAPGQNNPSCEGNYAFLDVGATVGPQITAFNRALEAAIARMALADPGVSLRFFDTASFFEDVVQLGLFANTSYPWYSIRYAHPMDVGNFLWWDLAHPTARFHKLLGEAVLRVLRESWL